MPFPNEHAARLRIPEDFNPKTFRRVNGGAIYGSKKVPSTVSVIWGKLKSADKPSDPVLPQTLRFASDNWTPEQAKKWLVNNNINNIDFEEAKEETKKIYKDAEIYEVIKQYSEQYNKNPSDETLLSVSPFVEELFTRGLKFPITTEENFVILQKACLSIIDKRIQINKSQEILSGECKYHVIKNKNDLTGPAILMQEEIPIGILHLGNAESRIGFNIVNKRDYNTDESYKDLDTVYVYPIEVLMDFSKGGEGSGNFGHEGRPGEIGGSGDGGSGSLKDLQSAEQDSIKPDIKVSIKQYNKPGLSVKNYTIDRTNAFLNERGMKLVRSEIRTKVPGQTSPKNFYAVYHVQDKNGTTKEMRSKELMDMLRTNTDTFTKAQKSSNTIAKMDAIINKFSKSKINKSFIFSRKVSFSKVDDEKRLVYGIVYEAGPIDSQEDYTDVQELEKAAHKFMEQIGGMNDMHQSALHRRQAVPIESVVLQKGDVYKGTKFENTSWVIGTKVYSDDIWKKVKNGTYTGFSMEGSANG